MHLMLRANGIGWNKGSDIMAGHRNVPRAYVHRKALRKRLPSSWRVQVLGNAGSSSKNRQAIGQANSETAYLSSPPLPQYRPHTFPRASHTRRELHPASMDLEPLVKVSPTKTAEEIWFEPRPKEEHDGSEYVVYLIPGNPCLISYYEPFLSTLFDLLNDGENGRTLPAHVGGYTLPGFEPDPVAQMSGITLPASLRSQIRNTEELIEVGLDNHIHQNAAGEDACPPKVILIAHSVGAYIALEILRRRAKGQNGLSKVDIAGGVFICPTVVHIAQSAYGAILNQLLRIPFFPAIVGMFVKLLAFLLPLGALHWLIAFFGRMPPHIAQATAEFLKSPWGVHQALFMARDEMHEIKEDIWDEAIWGSPDAPPSASVPLKFYFAENDVWVPNRARDALIASRGISTSSAALLDPWKPSMIIDDNKVPHGFIIGNLGPPPLPSQSDLPVTDHSKVVAEKVKSLIEEIIRQQNGKVI
ncbi:hypothetical protein FGG08_003293 [Glutinoglossum americanum]|uniref:Lipid droplet-associated hydrolase n=1 Tax=Glutinoglossum americanum TaxID=1670608 RepID=A0A9P8KY87_9PEZI|nr:hypothetical protein FGG08_003293 [Glutinoglossum americanum]